MVHHLTSSRAVFATTRRAAMALWGWGRVDVAKSKTSGTNTLSGVDCPTQAKPSLSGPPGPNSQRVRSRGKRGGCGDSGADGCGCYEQRRNLLQNGLDGMRSVQFRVHLGMAAAGVQHENARFRARLFHDVGQM